MRILKKKSFEFFFETIIKSLNLKRIVRKLNFFIIYLSNDLHIYKVRVEKCFVYSMKLHTLGIYENVHLLKVNMKSNIKMR